MSEIEELQRRITAAMDQVAYGLERLGPAGPSGPDAETLKALEEERTANAQLEERVRSLRAKAEDEEVKLRSQIDRAQARISELDIELQRVRRANTQLADACAALRAANAEGVGEAHLINKTMLAELEGLRAARAADVAEVDVILSTLTPLLDAAGDTAEETA